MIAEKEVPEHAFRQQRNELADSSKKTGINPVTALRKRNKKIRIMFAAFAFAALAAGILFAAPEIGLLASGIGSVVSAGGSLALTFAAKGTHV